MTINVYSFCGLLAFTAKSKFEPSPGRWLRDCGPDLKGREYDLINMFAQCLQGHSAKGLSHEINAHIVQDCLIVEE